MLSDSFLTVYAAFFGDSDRMEMMSSGSQTDSKTMGAFVWLFMHVFGVGLLSNIFIAVVGDVYSKLITDMEVNWEAKGTTKMRKHLWDNVTSNLHDQDPFLPWLLQRLPPEYRKDQRQAQHRGRLREFIEWLRARRPLRDLLAWLLAPTIFMRKSSDELGRLLNPPGNGAELAGSASRRPRLPPAASTEGLEVLEGEIISPPPRGKVAGSKLMTELDMLAVERAHRRGVESNPKAWYSHTSPDYDSVWYDEEAELRFRFSWSIVPRFNDEEVKLELETPETYDHRLRLNQQAELLELARSFRESGRTKP